MSKTVQNISKGPIFQHTGSGPQGPSQSVVRGGPGPPVSPALSGMCSPDYCRTSHTFPCLFSVQELRQPEVLAKEADSRVDNSLRPLKNTASNPGVNVD